MKRKSKWFRVATEGASTDGRTITRAWIEQMAANYRQDKYGARVWLEHLRGLYPDGPFRAYGDVLALRAEENAEGKLELFSQIDPTDDLVEMNKARQKIYTSIEVDPDFAGSGEAYMVGLGVTDSPASLGTEMLQFSATAQANPLAGRKQRPENLFTAAVETALEFAEEGEASPSLFEKVKALFAQYRGAADANQETFRADLEQTLGLFVEAQAELRAELEKRPTAEQFGELKTAHETLQAAFNELHAKLDNTPDTPPRQHATGSTGGTATDC